MCRSPEGYGNIASTYRRGRVSSSPPVRNVPLSAQYFCHLFWMACADGVSSSAGAVDRFSDNERTTNLVEKAGSVQDIGTPEGRHSGAECGERRPSLGRDLGHLGCGDGPPGDSSAGTDDGLLLIDQDAADHHR